MTKNNVPMENRMVKESNACARSRMTGQTRNANVLLKALIAQVRTDEPNLEKFYSVEIAPYFNCKNAMNLNTKQIKDAIDDLLSIKIFIETQRNKKYLLKGMVLIPEAEYTNGIITARFNSSIKEHLTRLKGTFTQFDALEYSALPSEYSQKLFEILKSYENGLNREFVEITVDELKKMLDCPQSMDDFQNFKRLVLNKAHSDINNKTSLRYDWEPVKTGRKITGIRFRIIKEKPAAPKKAPRKKILPLLAAAPAPESEPKEKSPAEVKRHIEELQARLRNKSTRRDGGLQSAGEILASALG